MIDRPGHIGEEQIHSIGSLFLDPLADYLLPYIGHKLLNLKVLSFNFVLAVKGNHLAKSCLNTMVHPSSLGYKLVDSNLAKAADMICFVKAFNPMVACSSTMAFVS